MSCYELGSQQIKKGENKLKRVLIGSVLVVLVLSLVLGGCAKTPPKPEDFPLPEWPKSVTIPYIGSGGSTHAMVLMLSQMIENKLKVRATPVQTRGSNEIIPLMYEGQVTVGYTTAPSLMAD